MRKAINRSQSAVLTLAVVSISIFFAFFGNGARAEAAVTLNVLNDPTPGIPQIVVCQDDPVEVEFEVTFGEDTSARDLIQLRRLDSGEVVSEETRGEASTGIMLLGTEPENVLGELEVVYILATTGAVLATADHTVLVVDTCSPEPPNEVEFPSDEAPTLQAAIDLVADGGKVKIKRGVFEVPEPIYVIGKMVIIEGSGTLREDKPDKVTRLVAPPPTGVVDAESAVGVINFIGGGGAVSNLCISGGDACIVGRPLDEVGQPLLVKDAHFSETARGILWLAPSDVTVAETKIMHCLWNGISFSPGSPGAMPEGLKALHKITILDTILENIENVGFAYIDGVGICDNLTITSCQAGAIVGYNSVVIVTDSVLSFNNIAGVALFKSSGFIGRNIISDTFPALSGPFAGWWGDGIIAALCSNLAVYENNIVNSARVGVSNFGSEITMFSNNIACAGFEMEVDPLPAHYFGPSDPPQETAGTFVDFGGNHCGCPNAAGSCVAQSTGLQPPEPQAPAL